MIAGTRSSEEVKLHLDVFPGERVEVMEAGLRDFGRVVLFVRYIDDDPTGMVDPEVAHLAGGDSLLITVADDGTLSVPSMCDAPAASFLAAAPTLSDLEEAARGGGRRPDSAPVPSEAHQAPDPPIGVTFVDEDGQLVTMTEERAAQREAERCHPSRPGG